MRTHYGISPWIDQLAASRRPEYARLRGAQTAQVAIVGGGLTGCLTAYACAVAGIKVVLIEGDRLGHGASARVPGLLLAEPGPSFRDVEKLHGVRTARTAFESWRRASLDGAALLKRLKIKCALQPLDDLLVSTQDEEKGLRREFEARSKAGLDVAWVSSTQLRKVAVPESPGAIRVADATAIDPYRACLGLAAAAASRGAVVVERSHVGSVKFGRRDVEILTEGGSVRAETVVVTTGTATAEFKPLRRHFNRRERYLVLTEPMPGAVRKGFGDRHLTFATTRMPPHRVRWTQDDRILIAGAEQDETPERRKAAVLVQRTGQLMYELLTMFPAISGLVPEYGWEVVSGETADGLPYIGPHRNYPRHLFALGSGGDSVTGAFLAARLLVRALRDAPAKEDEVWEFTR
jgi:glycine/D-amino acid oxidase-like deaminating enzyme